MTVKSTSLSPSGDCGNGLDILSSGAMGAAASPSSLNEFSRVYLARVLLADVAIITFCVGCLCGFIYEFLGLLLGIGAIFSSGAFSSCTFSSAYISNLC